MLVADLGRTFARKIGFAWPFTTSAARAARFGCVANAVLWCDVSRGHAGLAWFDRGRAACRGRGLEIRIHVGRPGSSAPMCARPDASQMRSALSVTLSTVWFAATVLMPSSCRRLLKPSRCEHKSSRGLQAADQVRKRSTYAASSLDSAQHACQESKRRAARSRVAAGRLHTDAHDGARGPTVLGGGPLGR